jgi:hypothetical protein
MQIISHPTFRIVSCFTRARRLQQRLNKKDEETSCGTSDLTMQRRTISIAARF